MWWKCCLVPAWWQLLELASRFFLFLSVSPLMFVRAAGNFDELKNFVFTQIIQEVMVFDEVSFVAAGALSSATECLQHHHGHNLSRTQLRVVYSVCTHEP